MVAKSAYERRGKVSAEPVRKPSRADQRTGARGPMRIVAGRAAATLAALEKMILHRRQEFLTGQLAGEFAEPEHYAANSAGSLSSQALTVVMLKPVADPMFPKVAPPIRITTILRNVFASIIRRDPMRVADARRTGLLRSNHFSYSAKSGVVER